MGLEGTSRQRYAAFAWPGDVHSPSLRHYWEQLSSRRQTPGAVYQSPAFFDYLKTTGDSSRLNVVAIIDRNTDAIAGVVPLQKTVTTLPFSVGERTLLRSAVSSIVILGSEPMVPDDPAALDCLFQLLAQHYPRSQAIDMDAVPQDGFLWKYLNASEAIKRHYDLHVLHGFRDCHSVDIPGSTADYYRRLTKKRRYNLLRQEKLLQEHAGAPLRLVVIDSPQTLGELFAAMDVLNARSDGDEAVLEKSKYAALAQHGFLCCFVLKAGERILGLTLGTKSGEILRIHRFFYDHNLEKYSPGTTLWQVVLRHLIREAEFRSVDMGYGTPAYRYRATNTIVQKGKVLLFRRSVANRFRILAHSGYSQAVNLLKARREGVHPD